MDYEDIYEGLFSEALANGESYYLSSTTNIAVQGGINRMGRTRYTLSRNHDKLATITLSDSMGLIDYNESLMTTDELFGAVKGFKQAAGINLYPSTKLAKESHSWKGIFTDEQISKLFTESALVFSNSFQKESDAAKDAKADNNKMSVHKNFKSAQSFER